jgi:two-component system sensor kinase FixL
LTASEDGRADLEALFDEVQHRAKSVNGQPASAHRCAAADPRPRSRFDLRWHDWRPLGAAVLVGGVYFAGAKVGLALTFTPFPLAVLWPPNALLFGALLLAPTRWWWLLLLGALPAHLLAELQAGVPLTMVLGWFASNVTEALVGAAIVRHFSGTAGGLGTARAVTVFYCAAVCAPVLSSFLDAGLVRLNGWGEADYWSLWRARVPSNLLSALIFVPVIVTCANLGPARLRTLTPRRLLEATLLIAGLLVVGIAAFDPELWGVEQAETLLYLPVPFLVWAAMRFGPPLTSASFTIFAFLVIWGATHGPRPFVGAARHEDALPVQLFLVGIAVPLLWLAAVIHERRQAEHRLLSSEQLFSTAFMASPDAIAISLRSTGEVIEANPRWLDLLGYRRDHLARGEVASLASHIGDHAHRAMLAPAGDHPGIRDVEMVLVDRHGNRRNALVSVTPVDAQDQACLLSIVRDITEQRQAEQESREQHKQLAHVTRVAALSDFSSSLAHELNQPLTAILSNAQAALRFLARDPLDVAEMRAILTEIAEADKRAGRLIHHLRQMIKRADVELVEVDLNQLIMQVLDFAHGEFVTRGVEVRTNLSPQLPHVKADRVQLQQLTLNLIANACEAMQGRAETPHNVLSITTARTTHGSVQVVLSDTGPGIPPHRIDTVFDAFFTTKPNGLGMGLAICRKIAQGHGGTLVAESHAGSGATFCLTLPTRPPDREDLSLSQGASQ